MKNAVMSFPQSLLRAFTNAGAAIASGALALVGGVYGVACGDIAASTGTGTVEMRKVVTLAKATGAAWTNGQSVYWDTVNSRICATSSTSDGNFQYVGTIFKAALSADTTAEVEVGAPPPMFRCVHTVTAAEDSANQADFVMPNGANPTGYYHAVIRTSAGLDRGVNTITFPTTGTMRVAHASLAAGDVICVEAAL